MNKIKDFFNRVKYVLSNVNSLGSFLSAFVLVVNFYYFTSSVLSSNIFGTIISGLFIFYSLGYFR